jgi:hypothetical protein
MPFVDWCVKIVIVLRSELLNKECDSLDTLSICMRLLFAELSLQWQKIVRVDAPVESLSLSAWRRR